MQGRRNEESRVSFQLKATFAPCTVLQIMQYDFALLEQQLILSQQRAPQFFVGLPIILDIDNIKAVPKIDFAGIKSLLIRYGLIPVGIWETTTELSVAALAEGLPSLSRRQSLASDDELKKATAFAHVTQLITHPVRSGMHFYAKEGDLIVTAPVSAGAELLADGHIHVYAPLRGRALAGVQGNHDARIFCSSLEAELVSIAGYYLTKEDMQALSVPMNNPIQIFLDNNEIRIQAIAQYVASK